MLSNLQNQSFQTDVLCKYPLNVRPIFCQAKTPYHNVTWETTPYSISSGAENTPSIPALSISLPSSGSTTAVYVQPLTGFLIAQLIFDISM